MNGQEEAIIQCPYCGETLSVLIDCSISHQQYIEDCQVCCRPIHLDVSISDDGDVSVIVKSDNEI
jgi:transcription elongation factor Elf1